MYLQQIEQLVILQKVDDEILILKKQIDNAPKNLAGLREKYDEIIKRKESLQEKLDIVSTQKNKLEHEIDEDGRRIKKSKNKLMMVGNTREYHAMMRELDNMEKQNRSREEEKSTLEEEVSRQLKMMEDINAELAVVEGELGERQANIDAELREAQAKLDTLDEKRRIACKTVPAPIMGRYEFIRKRLPQPVIVPVTNGICGGCFIAIPPQAYNELQKGQQILSCPNCQRLTYWEEHFSQAKG